MYKFILYRTTSATHFFRFGGRQIILKGLRKMEKSLEKDHIKYETKKLKSGYRLTAYSEDKDYLMANYNEMQTFLTNPLESFEDFTSDTEYLQKVTQNKYIKGKMDLAFSLGYSLVTTKLKIKTLFWVEDDKGDIISKK